MPTLRTVKGDIRLVGWLRKKKKRKGSAFDSIPGANKKINKLTINKKNLEL